jgi:hypothetical protein
MMPDVIRGGIENVERSHGDVVRGAAANEPDESQEKKCYPLHGQNLSALQFIATDFVTSATNASILSSVVAHEHIRR